jgi:predicted nucleic acid-binding protein
MHGILIDSNVLLDVFLDDPDWAEWSEKKLDEFSQNYPLYINSIIYTEISIGFEYIELLENTLHDCKIKMLSIPKEALFLAGKVFLNYRKRTGKKTSPLPDFYIGAQAAVLELPILTRDTSRYNTYFSTVKLVSP